MFCHISQTSCSSKPTSTSSTATTASSATTTTPPGGENLMIRAGDMSRRKQKNPKPFFTSNEDQEDQQQQQHQQQQHRREVEEDNKSCDGQNNNLNSRLVFCDVIWIYFYDEPCFWRYQVCHFWCHEFVWRHWFLNSLCIIFNLTYFLKRLYLLEPIQIIGYTFWLILDPLNIPMLHLLTRLASRVSSSVSRLARETWYLYLFSQIK